MDFAEFISTPLSETTQKSTMNNNSRYHIINIVIMMTDADKPHVPYRHELIELPLKIACHIRYSPPDPIEGWKSVSERLNLSAHSM